MDYMKCWMILKNELLNKMVSEANNRYSIEGDAYQTVLNDMAAIEVGITLGEKDGVCRE